MSTRPTLPQLIDRLPWPMAREMLLLMRFDRPIGTWLLMWPSLWALTAATQGSPPLCWLLFFASGAFIMRSAGCVANDLSDRDFDRHVERTKDRPLAAGRISVGAAKGLLLALLTIALIMATQLNVFTLFLCAIGAVLAVTYPLMKRYIDIPQFYMGTAFGWGAIITWAAMTGSLALEAWLIFFATLFWAAGYDTIYGMMDREDDLKIGVRSTAIFFGDQDIKAVGILYALALTFLVLAGAANGAHPFYYLSLMVAQAHMTWQLYSIRNYRTDADGTAKLLNAFLSNQWVGLIIFVGWGFR